MFRRELLELAKTSRYQCRMTSSARPRGLLLQVETLLLPM